MPEEKIKEHILVCLSSSPSNPKVIKTAAKMANVFDADFTALYIEMTGTKKLSSENKKRLESNTALARAQGAKVVTLNGDDIAYQVAQYAKTGKVTKIVIGRSGYRANSFFAPPNFVDKLIQQTPEIEIYVIPDKVQAVYLGQKHNKKIFKLPEFSLIDTFKTIVVFLLTTSVCLYFQKLNINESNMIMIYLLGVLITAYITESKLYSIISSVLAVLSFNYFFTRPYMTVVSMDSGYTFTFFIMFFVALFVSSITKKIKEQAKQSYLKAYSTQIMLDMSQKLQQAKNVEEIDEITIEQIKKLLDCDVLLFEPNKEPVSTVYECFPIRNTDTVFLNAAIPTKRYKSATEFEKNLFSAMLRESALAYEKETITQTKNELLLKHKQEELRSTLLRAISHDLRTPLTGISGNADIFLNNADVISGEKKHQIYSDIYDDSIWLLNLVENLLSVTRFDKNEINIKKESEFISDVIQEAVSHIGRRKDNYNIKIEITDESLSAKVDARLISQVVFNLVDNAMKYSPVNTTITIGAYAEGKDIKVFVSDQGNGISDEDKKSIFDMFYTVNNAVSSDSRRGLGLGLALCKAVVEAHGGTICVTDNKPEGTIFEFSLEGDFYE